MLSIFAYALFKNCSSRITQKGGLKGVGHAKNPLFSPQNTPFLQWGIKETILKLSWKFEENRMNGRFYFFKQKKEHKKWNPLYTKLSIGIWSNDTHWHAHWSLIDSFHITWWPWKPVQLDGHLDWLHIDTCGFLNNYTCTCIWNGHDFFKFRVSWSKCNQSKWPSDCIGFHGHHVMWNSSIEHGIL